MAGPAGPHPLHPQGVPSAEDVLSGMVVYVTISVTNVVKNVKEICPIPARGER